MHALVLLALAALLGQVGSESAPIVCTYRKPHVSSQECVMVINEINLRATQFGNELSCVGCDPANEACAPGCQDLVNRLYAACDGVVLPDGLYYDPAMTITGRWEDLAVQMKIAVERCGCNGALGGRQPGLALLAAVAVLLISWLV